MRNKTIIVFYLIIILGFVLRIYGINWDQGHHMHPDERAITLSVVNLKYPKSFSEFLSDESPWNPKFFAYGSFPFYLLRIAGDFAGNIDIRLSHYEQINLLGRFISSLFDTGTIVVIFFIGKNLKNKTLGLFSAFIYSISVLPIQLSHFYAVDTVLTFFMTLVIFLLLKLYDRPSIVVSFLIGVFLGLSLATKISATVITASVLLAISLDFVLIFLKSPHKPSRWFLHLPKVIKRIFVFGGIIFLTAITSFLIAQPYALIDSETFLKQITEQSHMTKNAFTFPYTLQYVGKVPYIYELKNIFLFGIGPVLGVLAFGGFMYVFYKAVFKTENFPWQKTLILLQFFLTYFLITGSFAIGFMRYMLPLYPVLSLFAGYLAYAIFKKYGFRKKMYFLLYLIFAAGGALWTLSFMSVYSRDNSRITASEWIYSNIEPGSVLATEHWDDVLPLRGQEKYTMLSLPMYEPDTMEKWDKINSILSEIDYIIIASNRLYGPLSRLTDCVNLPSGRCYVRTSLYYNELFSEKGEFKKTAEISSYPTIPFTNLEINDTSADESFTVYDHPKIIIFKKSE